jgi:hypothetical protein
MNDFSEDEISILFTSLSIYENILDKPSWCLSWIDKEKKKVELLKDKLREICRNSLREESPT